MDSGILIEGVNEGLEKYIELMYIKSGDSKVIIEEGHLLVIYKLNEMIICHADNKYLDTASNEHKII